MAHQAITPAGSAHDEHEHHETPVVFGFWIYLMTDCVLFGTLFAVFAVMRNQFAGGPTGKELFDLQGVGLETLILLLSSITFGFGALAAQAKKHGLFIFWLVVTFLLGLSFVGMEIHEFSHMVAEGHGPDRSAFLSAFFTLVSTHGLHVTCGLIWIAVVALQSFGSQAWTPRFMSKLTCLSLFWHFLDIVWICVFTFVYLMSVI
ncbi:cytochrome o ubiquinol oxidase subunit III [Acidomonas methanolica]|uniref:cytochrome o ubiquinol oxidase subunit III n=1 Tax=Acidomonas methanolica TaxID=437 RepID=UPI00211A2E77|nr:cytochrome o ubiquinol oxidase subunit III [Acidomonas methanolica]MCQ9154768.1 cytochrome o ubiquinol oxidase subunit III [Acidomonas methanolica]